MLFTDYAFPFEATSLLILVAMVGAIVLARAGARNEAAVITLNHYLVLSAILFTIGTAGVFLRRNVITVLLSIEIMLNAVNLTFVAAGRQFARSGRTDHRVLRHDGRRGRSCRRPRARHRALPSPGVAQPGCVHEPEMVRRHDR